MTTKETNNLAIPPTPLYFRIFDFLLMPFMFALSGFKVNGIQNTHGWHTKDIPETSLESSKFLEVVGTDDSKYKNIGGVLKHFGLFHMPIFGGWTHYLVLENKDFNNLPWFIGWRIHSAGVTQYSNLPIKKAKVRVLSGLKGNKVSFFGLTKEGKQVNLSLVDKGVIGDSKYADVPLY